MSQRIVNKPPQIKRDGRDIIIPERPRLSKLEAAHWLEKAHEEDERTVALNMSISCFPWDGAAAMARAIEELYGFRELRDKKTMFGPEPPSFMEVECGPGEIISVPWSNFKLPGIAGEFSPSGNFDDEPAFMLSATVRFKHKDVVEVFFDRIRHEVEANSIYRGKVIRISFRDKEDEHAVQQPIFLDMTDHMPDDLIFNEKLDANIWASIFAPILWPEGCEKAGANKKRGILGAGIYGTGKTLTAAVAANLGQRNGWTVLYLDDVRDLDKALYFAKKFQPAIVFSEDIDRVLTDRTDQANKVLNVLDGIDTKDDRIMVLLTTNFVEKLDPALLRPGRLDDIIHFELPDVDSTQRLIRMYAGDAMPEGEDLVEAGQMLAGNIPAVIAECVNRAKLVSVARNKGTFSGITASDVMVVGHQMRKQAELLKPRPEQEHVFVEGCRVLADGNPSPSDVAAVLSTVRMNGDDVKPAANLN